MRLEVAAKRPHGTCQADKVSRACLADSGTFRIGGLLTKHQGPAATISMNARIVKITTTVLMSCALLTLSACGGGGGSGGGGTVTYTVGGMVTGLTGSGLMLSNNGGDNLPVTANGAFTFATALPKGTAYSVSASTQPTNPNQNCMVRNGTGDGTITNADVSTVAVVCINVGRFAYVANAGSNYVSAYTIDASTGALSAVAGSPFAAGSFPTVVTLHPSGKFAYVANNVSNNISAYTIDAITGALTAVAGSPFGAGNAPFVVTIDPSGKFAYVANQSSASVSAYTIDATTGALTPVAGSPYAASTLPFDVVIDPSGKFVYVTNYGTNAVGAWSGGSISAYTINAATGALTPVAGSPFSVGPCPCVITIDPSGKFAYVANGQSGTVNAYTVDATSGVLTSVASSAGGFCPGSAGGVVIWTCGVTIDPSGKFAYVANEGGSTQVFGVFAFTINATTGALTAVAGSPFAVGTEPTSITIDPSGKFAYVLDVDNGTVGGGTVYAYTVNATTGALTKTGNPLAAGTEPTGVEIDPSGKFVYVANDTSNDLSAPPIEAYSIDASTGALTAVPGSPFAGGFNGGTPPVRVVVSN
jgi:6-phosphogluconolactonase